MSRGPLFRSVGDALCCAVLVLLVLPAMAWMVIDPAGFASAFHALIDAVFGLIDRPSQRI